MSSTPNTHRPSHELWDLADQAFSNIPYERAQAAERSRRLRWAPLAMEDAYYDELERAYQQNETDYEQARQAYQQRSTRWDNRRGARQLLDRALGKHAPRMPEKQVVEPHVEGTSFTYIRTLQMWPHITSDDHAPQLLIEQRYNSGRLIIAGKRYATYHMAECLVRLAVQPEITGDYTTIYTAHFPSESPSEPVVTAFEQDGYPMSPSDEPPGRPLMTAGKYLAIAAGNPQVNQKTVHSFDALIGVV